MKEGESYGVDKEDVEKSLMEAGFKNITYKKFEFGLNAICFAERI
jgi:hypothetical protein